MKPNSFENLTPDSLISGVESFTGVRYTGLTNPMHSYINRVYEIETENLENMILKYYRPGRWSYEAICDEHDFILDCRDDEIPVVSPVELNNDSTIGEWDDF
ncbi:MAG: serine/threonine protein kinase, partial [Proteobacteria bacterium]|nr:serine/threonine protein kinase [Pseudomonadota bacterium]